jgi:hypothetical protein
MYPRNTWGPTTKWGFLEEVPETGVPTEKEHFKQYKEMDYAIHNKVQIIYCWILTAQFIILLLVSDTKRLDQSYIGNPTGHLQQAPTL